MLIKRILAALALAAIGIPAIIIGGYYYFGLITLLLGIAAWEFGRIFKAAGHNASELLLVGGVVLLLILRAYFPNQAAAGLTLLVLAAMTWHLYDYEKGRGQAGSDFSITMRGHPLSWVVGRLLDRYPQFRERYVVDITGTAGCLAGRYIRIFYRQSVWTYQLKFKAKP